MRTMGCLQPCKGSCGLQRHSPAAAVAGVSCGRDYHHRVGKHHSVTLLPRNSIASTADVVLSSAVSYPSTAEPRLRSKRMAGNPADGLWAAITAAILRLELLSAAAVDRHERVGPLVISALAGTTAAMGLDAITLLRHGVPPYIQDLLFEAFAAWDTSLWGLALTAVALPITAWALRCWWVSSVQLLSMQGAAVTQLKQLLSGNHIAADQQQQQQPQVADSSDGSWMAGLLALVRGLCLASVAKSLTQTLISSSTTGKVIAAAAAVAAFAVAAIPVAMSSQQHQRAAVALLATEAAGVLAVVGLAPAVSAVAAAVISAGLWTLHRQLVMPRLTALKAKEGDEVQLHVSLRVAGTRAVFDATLASQPLKLVAGQLDPEFLQEWTDLSSDEVWTPKSNSDIDSEQQQQQQQQQRNEAASSSSTSTPNNNVRRVSDSIKSWMTDPAARWDTLCPFAAAAACDMYLGETKTVQVYNPKGVGYWNPSFSWWQPTADVAEKFGGELPKIGDVFWYPVAEGAYVQTRVAGVGQKHVELDANYGVVGTQLEMDIHLVKLQKQQR